MKFRCNELRHNGMFYPGLGPIFDTKAEALRHLEENPKHNVITLHLFAEMSWGKLCICGAVVKEEYFKEHKCK